MKTKQRPKNKKIQTAVRRALDAAFIEAWDECKAQIKGDVYALLNSAGNTCRLRVIDGCSGEAWWSSSLSSLITEYMNDLDGTCAPNEEHVWCDRVASDMEKQAKRLREHAKKLRAITLEPYTLKGKV